MTASQPSYFDFRRLPEPPLLEARPQRFFFETMMGARL
jgi:hypothetical protein